MIYQLIFSTSLIDIIPHFFHFEKTFILKVSVKFEKMQQI